MLWSVKRRQWPLAQGISSCLAPAFHPQKDTAKRLGECYFAIFPRRINIAQVRPGAPCLCSVL